MGLLDNYTGIGMSPRPTKRHQVIMKRLMWSIEEDLSEDLFALSEWVLDSSDLNSPAPDIVLYKGDEDGTDTDTPILFIEIGHNGNHKALLAKMKIAMQTYPSVEESFLYNYQANTWTKLSDHLITVGESYSEVLDDDLSQFV